MLRFNIFLGSTDLNLRRLRIPNIYLLKKLINYKNIFPLVFPPVGLTLSIALVHLKPFHFWITQSQLPIVGNHTFLHTFTHSLCIYFLIFFYVYPMLIPPFYLHCYVYTYIFLYIWVFFIFFYILFHPLPPPPRPPPISSHFKTRKLPKNSDHRSIKQSLPKFETSTQFKDSSIDRWFLLIDRSTQLFDIFVWFFSHFPYSLFISPNPKIPFSSPSFCTYIFTPN